MDAAVPQRAAVGRLMEARIAELECRIAFQDHTLDELGNVIARQQREIDILREQVRSLAEQTRDLRPSPLDQNSGDEPPPPHY